jgi:hypothetical protein
MVVLMKVLWKKTTTNVALEDIAIIVLKYFTEN